MIMIMVVDVRRYFYMKYCVTLIKKEFFEVEANNEDEAIEMACDLCDDDQWSFMEPVDEFVVERIDD